MQKIKKLIIIAGIFFITIPMQAKRSKAITFKQKINKICRLLEHPFYYKRKLAAQQLIHFGSIISPYLAKKYSRTNYLAKREIVKIWHRVGDSRSIKYIFSVISDKDEGVRMSVASSILELSDHKSNLIVALKNIRPRSRNEQNTIQEIINTISYKQVENKLTKLISTQGGYSVCTSQYRDIQKMGTRVIIPLLSMFSEDNYRFIHLEYERNYSKGIKMKLLAGYALAEMQDKITDIQRSIVLDRLHRTSFNKNPDVRRAVACILKRFGDSSFWQKIIEHDKKQIQKNPDDANYPYQLGMMFLHVNRNYQSIRHFKKAIFLNPHDSLAYYRLACAQARRNKRKKAFLFLKQGFQKGFHDYIWAKNDPDLKNLYNYAPFVSLLQEMKKTYEKDLKIRTE